MDFQLLAPQLQTGDIFLFGGTTPVSAIIDAITHSKYSHMGMVVRAPGSSGGDGLTLWQSFEPDGGVVLGPLEAFVANYPKLEAGATAAARLLNVTRTPAMLQGFDDYMPKVKGVPFPGFGEWIINYMSGCLGIEGPQKSFYCSELVAQTYMAMGLLKSWPLATVYTPGRFAEDAYDLQLQLGASFGAEIPVTTSN